MIKVVDNFLNQEELMEAHRIIETKGWYFSEESNKRGLSFWSMNLMNEDFFTCKMVQKIKDAFDVKLKLNKVYANGQTFGLDGSYHTDSRYEDDYTFLLYLSEIKAKNVDVVGGHTQFKIDDTIKTVEPIYNRGVLFKSNILHRGLAPSRLSGILRISIAFKMTSI
jgi:hypothetical protein